MSAPVLWELHYERADPRTGDPSDFERTVWAPPPIPAADPRDAIPADLREWAHMNGRGSRADAVAYALAQPADLTGYATTGAVAVLPTISTVYAEEIR